MSEHSSTYGEWIKAEIEIYQTYHNHKETMAWTATALFLVAGWGSISTLPRLATENSHAAVAIILFAFVAILGFVHMQFQMRWLAADISEGLRVALTTLYARSDETILDMHVQSTRPVEGMPRFVAEAIADVAVRKPRWGRGAWRDARWRSEIASYTLLFLTLVTMIGAVWRPPIREDNKFDALAKEISDLSGRVEATSQKFEARFSTFEARIQKRIDQLEELTNKALQRTAPSQSGRRQ